MIVMVRKKNLIIPHSPLHSHELNARASFNFSSDSVSFNWSDSITESIEKFNSMDKKNLLLKVYRGESKTSAVQNINKRWYIEVNYLSTSGRKQRKLIYISSKLKNASERERSIKEILRSFKGIDDIDALPQPTQKQHALFEALKSKHAYLGHKGRLDYNSKVKIFLNWIQQKDVRLINHQDAMNFVNYLAEKRNNTTINNYLLTLKLLFSVLVKSGKIKKSPFANIDPLKKVQKSLQRLNEVEQARLKKAIIKSDIQLWMAVQFVYCCFIRPGSELRRLKISNINFKEGYLQVPGEASKNSRTQNVVIPPYFLAWLIKNKIDQYDSNYFIIGSNGQPGVKALGANTLTRRHRLILDNLGFDKTYGLYSWKHTGVWNCVKAGLNIKEIQTQLRHHSLDMVSEYLKNLGVTDMPDIALKFPAI